MVLKALSLSLTYGGVKGGPGESGAAVVMSGSGKQPLSAGLGLRRARLQARLDAAGYGD
jgi:hypothetical protein